MIYSYVLEHLPDPVSELKALRKFLHEQSFVYIQVPNIKRLNTVFHNKDLLEYFQIAHLYHFSEITLKNCFKKAGYDYVNGNEIIQALLKIGEQHNKFQNEYESTINFLKKLEETKSNPSLLTIIKRKLYFGIYRIIVITNMVQFVKSLYYKYLTMKNKLN